LLADPTIAARGTRADRPAPVGKIFNGICFQLSRFLPSENSQGIHGQDRPRRGEADESQGWLEFIDAAKLIADRQLVRLISESTELTKIVSASYGTARAKEREQRRNRRANRGRNDRDGGGGGGGDNYPITR
jgi:hypothetical protein